MLRNRCMGPLSPSKWLMGILCRLLSRRPSLMSTADADLFHCRGNRSKPIGHDGLGAAIFLNDAASETSALRPCPLRGDPQFPRPRPSVIDSPPEIQSFAIDLPERLNPSASATEDRPACALPCALIGEPGGPDASTECAKCWWRNAPHASSEWDARHLAEIGVLAAQGPPKNARELAGLIAAGR